MNFLILWWLFSGSRDRYITETPEQREARLKREAEAMDAFLRGAGRVLSSWQAKAVIGACLILMAPHVLGMLLGGDMPQCQTNAMPITMLGQMFFGCQP